MKKIKTTYNKSDIYFFHSRCCNKHFEGIVKKGIPQIVCEQCGKYVATLQLIAKK